MAQSIFHFPTLRDRTEAASKLPKGNLPEVGTVVWDGGLAAITRSYEGNSYSVSAAGGIGGVGVSWRYATPAEIDQFERDSALPEIVDPIEAEVKAITDNWRVDGWSVAQIARVSILRGIEIERARKAGP